MRRWLAGGQASCSGPSTSTHCTASPGPLYLSAPILFTVCAAARPYGRDADVVLRLEVIDELDHRRLVGGRVEVADQVVLRAHQHRPGIDAEGDRLAVALDRRGGDAEAVPAAVRRVELADVIAFHADELNITTVVVLEAVDASRWSSSRGARP